MFSAFAGVPSVLSRENIILIEDGAQAFGSLLANNESIFHNAAISTLSFYPAKVLGGAGDGGAILTQNDDYAQKARQLANHGRSEHYSYDYVGWNSRLDALQAAYLNCGLIFLKIEYKVGDRPMRSTTIFSCNWNCRI